MSEYDRGPNNVCRSSPDALIAALRDVDELIGLPDFAVIFCVSPWPDGGWLAGFMLDDKEWADEQGLSSRFLPESFNATWSIFNGFKVGVNAHGSHMAEAIEKAVLLVRQLRSP